MRGRGVVEDTDVAQGLMVLWVVLLWHGGVVVF
jgi:hypothetical protein